MTIARALRDHGCDAVEVASGQSVPRSSPSYRRSYLVPYAELVRNEAGIPEIVRGNITTTDAVNTVVAAGRADLFVLDVVPGAETGMP